MEKNELVSKIIAANKAFVNNMPYLTDEEYDKLWRQLYDIDPDNPVLYHTTQDATLPVHHVPHIHKIMGTNKAFCMEDLKPFMARFGHKQLVLEPKYDGCAAVYYKGKEEKDDKLILEGNGEFGRDVTHHLPYIWPPTELRCYESVELIIPNELWKKEYGKNVRSTVAGWLAKAELEHKNTSIVTGKHKLY